MADQREPAAPEGGPWKPKDRRGPNALPAPDLLSRVGRCRNPERGPHAREQGWRHYPMIARLKQRDISRRH